MKNDRNTSRQINEKGRQVARRRLERQRRRKKRIRLVLLAVIVIIAAAYFGGMAYFRTHFYSKGTVFGVAMINQTPDSLKKAVDEKVKEYNITVISRNSEDVITAEDINLGYSDDGAIDEALEEQNPFLWIFTFATATVDQDIEVEYDENLLMEKVTSLDCMQEKNMTAPSDAHLEYEDGSFSIIPEEYGTQLDSNKTITAVTDAVDAGLTELNLDEAECYVNPSVTQDDANLAKQCEAANKVLKVEITYDFGDRTEVVGADQISEWITFDNNGSYSLDEDKVADYVHDLGLKYDTFGLTHEFTTHSGQTITLTGGDYGWCINKKKTVAALIELINAGESVTTEPVYLYSGICRDTNDIGDYYIEVCIAEQTMYMYKDGKCIISTPVVTGNVSKGTETPSGSVWAIDARVRDYTLSGQDYDSDVSFWMPFCGDVGIHDATWRSEFGGSIYKTNGSHGCVNTPYDAMKTIYENAVIGMPVIVY